MTHSLPLCRIVNIGSALGPMFVVKCTPERRKFFTDKVGHSRVLGDGFIRLMKAAMGTQIVIALIKRTVLE